MTHESEVHTLAAPYAMHALPADEVEPFEQHLEQCSSCRVEVDEIREVAARLGVAEHVEPSEELKRRVLAEISRIRPLPPVVDVPAGPQPMHRASTAWRRWWPRLSAAAAAVLLVVSGVLASMLVDENRQSGENDGLSAQIQQVVAASDMKLDTERSAGGKAVVMSSRSQDTAVVLPVGMDPAPEGRVYQAWLIHGDDIRSAGLLRRGDDTTQPLVAHDLGEADRVGITVEPDGGSDQPTTDPVMLFKLPA